MGVCAVLRLSILVCFGVSFTVQSTTKVPRSTPVSVFHAANYIKIRQGDVRTRRII